MLSLINLWAGKVEVMERIKAMASKVANAGGTGATFPLRNVIFISILALACFIVWLKYRGTYETTGNVRDIVATRYASATAIVKSQGSRFGLEKYLDPCKDAQDTEAKLCKADDLAVPPKVTDIVLSNFYFATAYLTGCFLPVDGSPTGSEYVFSTDAVRFACRGGARAFVMDIWPSMEPNEGFRPVLQVVEAGSDWRRTSMNALDFGTAIETIVSEIYSGGDILGNSTGTNTQNDICILYLRFRGVPRLETYRAVAAAITKHAQPHLLDPSFAYCRGAGRLIKTSIRELKGKMIFLTNLTVQTLQDNAPPIFSLMNMCAPSPSSEDTTLVKKKIEYTLSELQNLTDKEKISRISYIRNMITFVMPPEGAEVTNDWDWYGAYNMGIHCIPMNFFGPRDTGMSGRYFTEVFGRYSYRLKAATVSLDAVGKNTEAFEPNVGSKTVSLRLPITVVPEAPVASDPGTGDGTLTVKGDLSLQGLDPCAAPLEALVKSTTAFLSKDALGAYKVPTSAADKQEIKVMTEAFYTGKVVPAMKQIADNKCLASVEFKDRYKEFSDLYGKAIKEVYKLTDGDVTLK